MNDEWDPDAWGPAPSPKHSVGRSVGQSAKHSVGQSAEPSAGQSAEPNLEPSSKPSVEATVEASAAAPTALTDTSPSTPDIAGDEPRAQTPGSVQHVRQPGEGTRIGGYLLQECIGQGGMARVYRAEHEGLQRQVAVKVLLEARGEGHERFLREARIAAAIKHRNVVNIFDVGVDRGVPFLVMELLEGADLDSFMGGKNRLDEATTMEIIVPITSALSTVHDAGIVHRDLKPGNIFLARGGNDELEPRLLDFGISKSVGDQLRLTSTHGPVLGTPFYMSPEAASGAEMTPLSDQYALGVVLYECVTGVNPFAGSQTFAEIVRRITTGDYKPVLVENPLVSRRMAAIIERAMQVDPAQRFPDLRALGRELLLLAGQRTRVTWQLSFNELNRPAQLAAGALEAPVPLTRRARPRSLALVPALALLSFAVAWGSGALQGLGLPGLAPLPWSSAEAAPSPERPELTLALTPAPDDPEAAPRPAAPSEVAEPPIATATLGLAEGALLADESPEATDTPADERPGASAPKSSKRAERARRRAPPRSRRAARRSTKPEAKEPSLEYGTNNAPILD